MFVYFVTEYQHHFKKQYHPSGTTISISVKCRDKLVVKIIGILSHEIHLPFGKMTILIVVFTLLGVACGIDMRYSMLVWSEGFEVACTIFGQYQITFSEVYFTVPLFIVHSFTLGLEYRKAPVPYFVFSLMFFYEKDVRNFSRLRF